MDTTFATLACCLLASFTKAQTEERNLAMVPTTTTPGLNMTHTPSAVPTSSDYTEQPNQTVDTTPFTSSTWGHETLSKTTSPPQTPESTNSSTAVTNSTSLITTMPGSPTPPSTVATTPTTQTTAGYTSTPETSGSTTADSSHAVNPTSDSVTSGFGLNISEKNMTIVFSVALGAFALALVVFMYHRCKQKIQYLHQPLNNTTDTNAFVADDDTLIISGGLYDGHPIYDNMPTGPEDQSQLRLEFLH